MLSLILALQIGSLAPPVTFASPDGPVQIDSLRGSWILIGSGLSPEASTSLHELKIDGARIHFEHLGAGDASLRDALGLAGGKRVLLFNPNLRLVKAWDSEPEPGFAQALRNWFERRGIEPGETAVDPRPFLVESGAITQLNAPKGLVILFLQSDGAVDQLYRDRLKAAGAAAKAAGLGVLGLFPAFDEEIEAVAAWSEELDFQCAVDPGSVFADAYRATRTPEVFVLNSSGKVVYTGSVDSNTWEDDGMKTYLLNAIAAVSEGRAVRPSRTFPFGTTIRRTGNE